VLIRPDGYVVWATPGDGELLDALHRWFGPSVPAPGSPTPEMAASAV